jgi:hypothetical protein
LAEPLTASDLSKDTVALVEFGSSVVRCNFLENCGVFSFA